MVRLLDITQIEHEKRQKNAFQINHTTDSGQRTAVKCVSTQHKL